MLALVRVELVVEPLAVLPRSRRRRAGRRPRRPCCPGGGRGQAARAGAARRRPSGRRRPPGRPTSPPNPPKPSASWTSSKPSSSSRLRSVSSVGSSTTFLANGRTRGTGAAAGTGAAPARRGPVPNAGRTGAGGGPAAGSAGPRGPGRTGTSNAVTSKSVAGPSLRPGLPDLPKSVVPAPCRSPGTSNRVAASSSRRRPAASTRVTGPSVRRPPPRSRSVAGPSSRLGNAARRGGRGRPTTVSGPSSPSSSSSNGSYAPVSGPGSGTGRRPCGPGARPGPWAGRCDAGGGTAAGRYGRPTGSRSAAGCSRPGTAVAGAAPGSRPRTVRGARRGTAVGLPGTRGGRRHRAQRTRDSGPASGRGRRDVARTGRRRRWRVPRRARTPVRPRPAVPCAGGAGGRDRPQRSRCRRPPLPDSGRHRPHRAGRRRALSTVRQAVRRAVASAPHRGSGRDRTGLRGSRRIPADAAGPRSSRSAGHGARSREGRRARDGGAGRRGTRAAPRRGPGAGAARPGVGRVRAPVRPAATDRRRWRDRPVRALTAPPAATPARAAFAVLGEQLGDGALPRVVDLRTHRLHRASSVVSVPGPCRARCAERSVMRARASDADARPRGDDAQGSAG